MPERDANQLAADVRAALSYCCGDDPAPGQTWEENNRAGVAALDDLAGLVHGGNCIRGDDGKSPCERLEALVGTLQQERDAERRWCKHWAERAEAAEAALATTRQALAGVALWLASMEGQTVSRADLANILPDCERALADTGGDTKEPA